MRLHLLALLFTPALGFGFLAPPASGQQQDDLARLNDTLTTLWQRGDAAGLVRLGAGTGVELEVQGHALGSLTGRRAAAALRHLFAAQQTVAVRSGPPSRVAGADHRAFVELSWEVSPPGTAVTERNTVFIGFVREGAHWKISQIRILP